MNALEARAGEAWTPVSESVFSKLSEAILNGELEPGSKISEPEVSRRFGISRAPLREAIRRLEERSLVSRVPRQSPRVIALTPERIREIFIVREAMEGMAAREAARNASDDEIARLQDGIRRKAKLDYHLAIVRASRNSFLIKFLCEDYQALIELCRRQQRRRPERVQQSLVEHGRIVDALAARDADLAEMLMRRHVAAAREHVMSYPQEKK